MIILHNNIENHLITLLSLAYNLTVSDYSWYFIPKVERERERESERGVDDLLVIINYIVHNILCDVINKPKMAGYYLIWSYCTLFIYFIKIHTHNGIH